MSLKVNKDNIFFLLPESRYTVSDRIDGYMEKDFTVHVRARVFADELVENREAFLISRNGMHSGISFFKDGWDKIICVFSYWFENDNKENVVNQVFYKFEDNDFENFNDYTMICDDTLKIINCYVNSKLIGNISYLDKVKVAYNDAFYWFGCGSMICDEEHRSIGEFEYDTAFVLNTKLAVDDVSDIVDNYETKYTSIIYNGLRKLNDDFKYKPNFAFFCDFKEYNRYKIWDISFNGNYPQFYIENNIYF
jgi:hypothetical protein